MSFSQYIVFHVEQEQYGVPVSQVYSIERLLMITEVPRTLPFIRGVINLRGIVTPVLDLRERFEFEPAEHSDETRIVIVELNEMTVGMIVDAVSDVVTIEDDCVEAPPMMVGGLEAKYLQGIAHIGDNLLILLNLSRVLSDAESRQLFEVEKSIKG